MAVETYEILLPGPFSSCDFFGRKMCEQRETAKEKNNLRVYEPDKTR